MTAVSQQPPSGFAAATPGPSRWERALIILGICLPVPLFAATGLTIPLPASVERLAAALVPWAEATVLDQGYTLARGSIVLTAAERRAPEPTAAGETLAPTLVAPETKGEKEGGKSTSVVGEGSAGGGETKPGSTTPDTTKPTGDGGGGTSPDTTPKEGGSDPAPAPSPIDKTLDDAGNTVTTIVDGAGETVGGVVEEVGGAVDTVGGTVTGVLPGL